MRARSRADGIFLLRVFPAMSASIVVLGVFLPAYCRFEPRETGEMVGRTLAWLAGVSGVLLAQAVGRAWRSARATRRVVRAWLAHARPVVLPGTRYRAFAIDAAFPVVSVVGAIRPRVFVSERVLGECTPDELTAMVRHECGHLAAGDNLKRFLLRACPSLLPLASLDRDLERHWHEACEEAADDYAASGSAPAALALANALVRIARMVPHGRAMLLPAASLYQGGSVERRIRRLLGGDPCGSSRTAWLVVARLLALGPLVLALAVLVDTNLLHSVHHLIEAGVETLP
jgi:Zn-dependent protease with chaperone function